MKSRKRWITVQLLIALFLVGIPSLTPHAYGAATPCSPKCGISILSPGSGGTLNKNQTVNPSFIVSFAVSNFTLDQPGTGTTTNVNTTIGTGGSAHNEGHIHVFVDGVYVTIWASADGIPLSLTPGTHTIRLDLVNDYHQEFSPGINATTTVNVINTEGSLQTNVSSAQGNASNAMSFSLGALVVSIITLILVAYIAFKPKPKSP